MLAACNILFLFVNSAVLMKCLNFSVSEISRTFFGRRFQSLGNANEKDRHPSTVFMKGVSNNRSSSSFTISSSKKVVRSISDEVLVNHEKQLENYSVFNAQPMEIFQNFTVNSLMRRQLMD